MPRIERCSLTHNHFNFLTLLSCLTQKTGDKVTFPVSQNLISRIYMLTRLSRHSVIHIFNFIQNLGLNISQQLSEKYFHFLLEFGAFFDGLLFFHKFFATTDKGLALRLGHRLADVGLSFPKERGHKRALKRII